MMSIFGFGSAFGQGTKQDRDIPGLPTPIMSL